jgi:formylglycine-generating enzyme required for sulfatase activity
MSSAADQTASLYQYLQSSGLLTDAQLRELRGWIAHKKPDVKVLAQEVARRGWLTPFQIKEIAKNRADRLRVAERYVLVDVLGEGGMGRVYKAHDTRMGRDIAFKIIRKEKLKHPAAAGRFVQEVQALGKLGRHPNVVEVYEAAQVGDNHYCVMEYIDGADLTKIIRDTGLMSIPQACDAIRQAALGLEHAFQTGLVHRDIKPSNIIVPRNGGPVKLVDLGLARVIDTPPGGEDAHRITQEGFVIGTPDFLAPEQARDPMSVDIRADIYSLGGTLFYILTGRVPYDGGTATEKLLKHCTDPPPNLLQYRPDAPPALQQLIHWCMAKRAEERPQTPLQLAQALQPFCPFPTPSAAMFGMQSPAHYAGLPGAPIGSGAYPGLPPAYPQANYPPAYPQPQPPLQPPVYAPPGTQIPLPDPNPSSQVFKLPTQTNDEDPIRKRSEGKFPVGLLLILLGGLFVMAIGGFAAYRMFVGPEQGPLEPFTNSYGMKMVKLEGGTFRMGSPENEVGRQSNEGPVHEVTIRGPFFMSATEVSHSQFLRVMTTSPTTAGRRAKSPEHMPVDSVTWDEANEFCNKLTEKEKNQPWMRKGWAYRLPTEAEWEYACRGGTDTPTAFGDHIVFPTQAMYKLTAKDPKDPYEAGEKPKESFQFGQPVGKTEANRFGLHDMHGNVAEWCSDWYRSEAYNDAVRDNPTGPADGDKRVIRGGSFSDHASALRSAARSSARPTERLATVGFRVVYAPIQK